MSEVKEGALRVWAVRNVPNVATRIDVATPEEGARLINRMAKADLKDPSVEDNAFGLETFDPTFEGGSWVEWYDPETGDDITPLADALWDEES